MKRFLVLLVWCLVSVNIIAEKFEHGGIYYETDYYNLEVLAHPNYKYEGNIIIPDCVERGGVVYKVASIGQEAFAHCENLRSVVIPNTVTIIKYNAFTCSTGLVSVTIPNSVSDIQNGAFWGCTSLSAVTIPNKISILRNWIFEGCSSLASVTLPESLEIIGDKCFLGCKALSAVNLPSSLTTIGRRAFEGCSGLTSIHIPRLVNEIEQDAFLDCPAVTSITVDEHNETYDSRGNCNAIIRGSTLVVGCSTTRILNDIWTIADNAFKGCTGLTSLFLPNSVNDIGKNAFDGCTGLTSLSLSNSLRTIGDYAFKGCKGLTSFVLPSTVHTIGKSILSGCSGLLSLTVDEQNTTYDSRDNCNAIIYRKYEPMIGRDLNILVSGCSKTVIPNTVDEIAFRAFEGQTQLTSISIPSSVRYCSDLAFKDCDNLASIIVDEQNSKYDSRDNCNALIDSWKSILLVGGSLSTIPNSVRIIYERAFCNRLGLTSITIPESVYEVQLEAFVGCTNLKKVYCKKSFPPSTPYVQYYDVFDKKTCEEGTLYVPIGRSESYRKCAPWSRFKNIEEFDFDANGVEETLTDDVQVSVHNGAIEVSGAENIKAEVYDMSGKLIYSGMSRIIPIAGGVYIVRVSNKSFKITV